MKKIIVAAVVAVVSVGLLFPQVAWAAKKKIYVPIVASSGYREGALDKAADQNAAAVLGANPTDGQVYLGLTKGLPWIDPDDPIGVIRHYWNKKIEVKAIINKGVTLNHEFAWYQQFKGICQVTPFERINFVHEDWAGDDEINYEYGLVYPYGPNAVTTRVKDSSRAIYLYDAPGLNVNASAMGAEEIDRSAVLDVQFRDFVKFKTTTDNGLIQINEADIKAGVPGANPIQEWSRKLVMHKNARVAAWTVGPDN